MRSPVKKCTRPPGQSIATAFDAPTVIGVGAPMPAPAPSIVLELPDRAVPVRAAQELVTGVVAVDHVGHVGMLFGHPEDRRCDAHDVTDATAPAGDPGAVDALEAPRAAVGQHGVTKLAGGGVVVEVVEAAVGRSRHRVVRTDGVGGPPRAATDGGPVEVGRGPRAAGGPVRVAQPLRGRVVVEDLETGAGDRRRHARCHVVAGGTARHAARCRRRPRSVHVLASRVAWRRREVIICPAMCVAV